ncbi:hypothetical protein EPN81_01385 [Patescibacteria group bacterium]|nr:MAG: hypothetical protein EPN81_01385 [Patescibacteria group bacterium]
MDALHWVTSPSVTEPPQEIYCQTRDIVQAKVESVRMNLLQHGWDESTSSLIVAVLGELTSNAFDHNLGQWPDVPGCWFETTIDPHRFVAIIADRGQGVRSSLQRVRPGINDHEALRIAFTEHITGRAPEKRGNGLKFVINALREFPKTNLTFQSGDALLSFHGQMNPEDATLEIINVQTSLRGVVSKIELTQL